MTITLFTLLGLLTTQAAGVAQHAVNFNQLTASYVDAFNANDAAKLARLFADDTVLMPPETPMIRDRSAVEAAYSARFANLSLRDLRMEALDFESHGERATAVGTFSLSSGPDGALATGKYIVIYKRVKDAWLIAYQIMNYDSPLRR